MSAGTPSCRRAGAGLLLLLSSACKPVDAGPRSALIIVPDGVRVEELTSTWASDLTGVSGEENARQIWRQMPKDGVVVRSALNPHVTITGPAHAALLTGHPEVYANFPTDGDDAGVYRPTVPTIFEAAREGLGLGEGEAVLIANNEFLSGVSTSVAPGFGEGAEWVQVLAPSGTRPANSDTPVLDELMERIEADPPRLAVVNLHDVDRAGHFGEGDAYLEGVDDIDVGLAAFWKELQQSHAEYAAGLLTIVVSDHGRHRHEEDSGWHNHGDACTGCRQIPMFLLGPTLPGEELAVTVATEDVAPTVAAWMRFDLPYATGLPVAEAFEALDAEVRTGTVDLAVSGEHTAGVLLRDDRDARSEVVVDGVRVSTRGVFGAEGAALLGGSSGLQVCFRELDLAEDDGFWRWTPRCLAEDAGSWTEMGFPDEEVGAWWRPALVERDGVTWVAWPENRRESGEPGKGGSAVTLSVASWTEADGWSEPVRETTLFPADVTLVPTDGGLVVATGASNTGADARYSRRARVFTLAVEDGVASIVSSWDLAPKALGEILRVERPALSVDGATVRVAALATTEEGTGVVTATSGDGGQTWGEEAVTVPVGDVFPHLSPSWDGEWLVWVQAGEEEAELCRTHPGEGDTSCVSAGSARVQSCAVSNGVATVVRDAGVGQWETAVVSW